MESREVSPEGGGSHEHAEHEHHDHHAMMEKDFRKRFFIVALLTLPILALSPTVQQWLGFKASFAGWQYLLFVLATIVTVYGTWPFFKGAVTALRRRVLDMSVLVSVAVLAGYLFSVGSTFVFESVDFYWEISTLVAVLLLGHWLEMRAIRGTTGALRELLKLIPATAHRLVEGQVEDVETSALVVGDILLVRPGEQVPLDGEVIDGQSDLNEAMVTGESRPVSKQPGDAIIGGTVNGDGALQARVTHVGNDTTLAQIVRLVRDAQVSKPPVQRLADRAAHWLTIIAVTVGVGTFVFWLVIGNQPLVFALTLAVTVLVIACPHALGLAVPVVTTISTTLGAKFGVLIRNAEATEASRKIDVVVFDKTGTLTRGEFGVTDILPAANMTESELLRIVAAAERSSEHTIAQGIVRSADERGIDVPAASGFQAIPGQGARAEVEGQALSIGNRTLMSNEDVTIPDLAGLKELEGSGKTLIHVSSAGTYLGAIGLADLIREESREAISALRELGIQSALLTGDSQSVADWVAGELGIEHVFAQVKPEDKREKVIELQREGHTVGMVGDGINDAPALVQADVGIAIGAGTNVAIESADVVLMKNDPRDVVRLVRLSRATMRKMKQNLVWATGYNAIAIPAAAGVFYPLGFVLEPQWGALIMAASTIIVAFNALLLRRARL
ncbi:heavy metal translocating P-type ATPase [Candidatus Bipolaricaulota bacterium]